ncbi:MAG: hypothetical protein AAFO82_04875 [Bacteroidota bacterium]
MVEFLLDLFGESWTIESEADFILYKAKNTGNALALVGLSACSRLMACRTSLLLT